MAEHGAQPGPARARLGPLPRPLGLALIVLWAALTAIAAVDLLSSPAPWIGDSELLVPLEDRTRTDMAYALVRVDFDALAERGGSDQAAATDRPGAEPALDAQTDPSVALAEACLAIEEALGEVRRPLAPPRTEITAWLDAHALYLLPLDTHAALAERLTDEAMRAEVQGLRARLSSPLFVVSGEQPRRDPLAIHELSEREAGRLGHVAEPPGGHAPQVSPSGDLLSASGDRALIGIDPAAGTVAELDARLREALDGLPVSVALIDARARQSRIAAMLGEDWLVLAAAGLAALVLLLSVVLRRVIPALALALCLTSAWAMLVAGAAHLELGGFGLGGVDVVSFALIMMALGVGCDAALRLPKIGPNSWSWAPPAMCALALAPLALSPYPLWQRWALAWFVAQALITVVMRLVFPALLALARDQPADGPRGFSLTPTPIIAGAVCLVIIGVGAWAVPQLDYRSLARLPIDDETSQAQERELVSHFFDPSMVVEARSRAPGAEAEAGPGGSPLTPEAAALDAAAQTVAALAVLVPDAADRVDSPGSFVLPHAELEARKQALALLDLDGRMEVLSGLLEDQGLRDEAFDEFLDGAADIEEIPSAQAALDGPLGPWIRAYLVDEGEAVELRTLVELRGADGWITEPPSAEALATLPALRGPAIAALTDARELGPRAGLILAAGVWLSALIVWLATRRLANALATVVAAGCAQLSLAVALLLLDQPIGPQWLPVALLVGVTAALSGARSCDAVRGIRRLDARMMLLATGCQIAIGVVMLGSPQPLWRELGLGFAVGSAVACGLGLFVAPGLTVLFAVVDRVRPKRERGTK